MQHHRIYVEVEHTEGPNCDKLNAYERDADANWSKVFLFLRLGTQKGTTLNFI
jgi:hypothetical protein